MYDVTADDQQSVMLPRIAANNGELILVQNFFEELRRVVL